MINSVNNLNTPNNLSFKAKPMPIEEALRLKSALSKGGTSGIYPHDSADLDAAKGSNFLKRRLKKWQQKAVIFAENRGLKYLGFSKKTVHIQYAKPDNLISFDHGSTERFPKVFAKALEEIPPENRVVVDHHEESKDTAIKCGYSYIDATAKSCCAIMYRLVEALGEKLNKNDLRDLYAGMLSDYEKSELVKFKNSKLIKQPALNQDKNAKEVLEKVEVQLSQKDKNKIYRHLDILSNLTPKEKALRAKLLSQVQVTPNGRLAYVIIPLNDKKWASMGMDTIRNSDILRDVRLSILNSRKTNEKLKNIEGVMIFYREKPSDDSLYKMSIHSVNHYAQQLTDRVKATTDLKTTGGHPDRSGGRIFSVKQDDVQVFINNFLQASQALG